MLTILPTKPQDFGLIVAPEKVVNQNLDKIRITASGIMGASALAGLMFLFAHMTRDQEKKSDERDA